MLRSHVIDVPLGVDLTFPERRKCRMWLNDAPRPGIARTLAEALVSLCNTGGPIKSPGRAQSYGWVIRRFCEWLDANGGAYQLRNVTSAELLGFLRSRKIDVRHEVPLKALLLQANGTLGVDLQPDVHAIALSGRRSTLKPRTSVEVPALSLMETRELRMICKAAADAVEARLDLGARLLQGSATRPWALPADEVLRVLAARPTVSREELVTTLGLGTNAFRYGVAPITELKGYLYVTPTDLVPFSILLGLATGVSPESLANLRMDSWEHLGEGRTLLRWTKRRAEGTEADTFRGRSRWAAGGLLDRVAAITERGRLHAATEHRDALWLALHSKMGRHDGELRPIKNWSLAIKRWLAAHDVRDDEGEPLELDRRRLRKTFYAELDRAYHGAVQIIAGPNQTARTAADHYLAATTETDALSRVIESSQRELVSRARRASLLVLNEAETETLSEDAPSAARTLSLPAADAARVLTTEEDDVFMAKCRNFYDSPHGTKGKPCPAAAWECLLCKQAVVTPSKLPNILRLLEHIDEQHTALSAADWQDRYLAVRDVITEDILPKYSDTTIAAARTAAEDANPYLPDAEHGP